MGAPIWAIRSLFSGAMLDLPVACFARSFSFFHTYFDTHKMMNIPTTLPTACPRYVRPVAPMLKPYTFSKLVNVCQCSNRLSSPFWNLHPRESGEERIQQSEVEGVIYVEERYDGFRAHHVYRSCDCFRHKEAHAGE